MQENADPQLPDYYPSAHRRLVAMLRLMGVSNADSLEVAQEAFVRLIPRWDQVAARGSPDAWLRTVAWRIHLNRRRSWARVLLLRDVPENPEATLTSLDEQIDIRTALSTLPLSIRQVAVMYYWLDLPIATIASELGIANGTVKSRLARARSALGRALDPLEEHHVHRER